MPENELLTISQTSRKSSKGLKKTSNKLVEIKGKITYLVLKIYAFDTLESQKFSFANVIPKLFMISH